jgi:DNA-directed RNA polymerase
LPTDKIDKIKMSRSFRPNFIHYLDASNVHLLILYLSALYATVIRPLYKIHDCFGSTPNNIALLEGTVKKAFIDIYFKDEGYLLKAHNKIIKEIKDSLK